MSCSSSARCGHLSPQRILRLQDEYGIQGLQIVLINSNDPENVPEDSFEGMKQRAREHHYIVPYLWDKTQGVAKRFGAVCTPEAFLFDRKRQLKYRGRIDDNWRDPNRVKERSLALAVSDVLAGKEPVPHERPAMGCSIKWKQGNEPQY